MSDRHWIEFLEDEDLAFLKRFVLASGSLKDLAKSYGISYPTVRLRLDRLINKITIFDSHHSISDFERTLRALYVDGKIDLASLKTLLTAHRKEKELEQKDASNVDSRPGDLNVQQHDILRGT